MNNFFKISIFVLLLNIAAKANAANNGTNNNVASENNSITNSDSTTGVKSNIIIFKIIATPSPSSSPSNGSLKKAGKVARTSYSHTSIESILMKGRSI